MATLNDVARRAGVSPMTVSRVVNGSPLVSAQTRARVEEALAEAGYMPNMLARSLRSKRTDTIALLLTDMTNPFFMTLAQGVETAARERSVTMILANCDENEDEELRLIRVLLQRKVDGLLVVPAGTGTAAHKLCQAQGVHLVQWGPADFGFSRGQPGLMSTPDIREHEERLIATCLKIGLRPRIEIGAVAQACLLYTSPSPRD